MMLGFGCAMNRAETIRQWGVKGCAENNVSRLHRCEQAFSYSGSSDQPIPQPRFAAINNRADIGLFPEQGRSCFRLSH
jgi:hypothetical protein